MLLISFDALNNENYEAFIVFGNDRTMVTDIAFTNRKAFKVEKQLGVNAQ